jgi:hypothetical protein
MYMDLYVLCIPLYFSLHVSGAICTLPQEHNLQRTAIGMCSGYGVLIGAGTGWDTLSTVLKI